ncbi:hypothetical protein AOQ84DRAFT_230169 [Glonium stellatum]|uniref:Uncharacterized protein n=1 Tax=Glonium stellatum TaxID=574774 RepID=A0A8E2JVR6_9PEZI|nr:hypothetical protein AOQ84DRAFT_230169 [Glonium stellatum]
MAALLAVCLVHRDGGIECVRRMDSRSRVVIGMVIGMVIRAIRAIRAIRPRFVSNSSPGSRVERALMSSPHVSPLGLAYAARSATATWTDASLSVPLHHLEPGGINVGGMACMERTSTIEGPVQKAIDLRSPGPASSICFLHRPSCNNRLTGADRRFSPHTVHCVLMHVATSRKPNSLPVSSIRPTYLPACLLAPLPRYLPTYLPACLPAYLPMYLPHQAPSAVTREKAEKAVTTRRCVQDLPMHAILPSSYLPALLQAAVIACTTLYRAPVRASGYER